MSIYLFKDLKGWQETEENLLNDPQNLSQAQWDRHELACATDRDAFETPAIKAKPFVDTPVDCPF